MTGTHSEHTLMENPIQAKKKSSGCLFWCYQLSTLVPIFRIFPIARPWSHHGWCLHGLASEPSLSVADHAKRDHSWVVLGRAIAIADVSMYGHSWWNAAPQWCFHRCQQFLRILSYFAGLCAHQPLWQGSLWYLALMSFLWWTSGIHSQVQHACDGLVQKPWSQVCFGNLHSVPAASLAMIVAAMQGSSVLKLAADWWQCFSKSIEKMKENPLYRQICDACFKHFEFYHSFRVGINWKPSSPHPWTWWMRKPLQSVYPRHFLGFPNIQFLFTCDC